MRFRGFSLAIILLGVAIAYGNEQRQVSEPKFGKVFFYTARKLGIPILRGTLRIENIPSGQDRPLCQVRLEIVSVNTGFFFRMNNRFTSIFEAENCIPVQYVKEIDQDGLFKEKKHYHQILTFDFQHQKVVVEKTGEKGKQEILLPPETFDPLSMFARCYLKEDLRLHQEFRMTIYDGVKLRQMVFQPRQGKIKSKIYGEVDAVCLEAATSFASFEDKEGMIRIWYMSDGKKTPILMELDLPIGIIRFELDEVKEG